MTDNRMYLDPKDVEKVILACVRGADRETGISEADLISIVDWCNQQLTGYQLVIGLTAGKLHARWNGKEPVFFAPRSETAKPNDDPSAN